MKKMSLIFLSLVIIKTAAAFDSYTFSYWENGWRKNSDDHSKDIFWIETSKYALALDVADFSKIKFGKNANAVCYEYALQEKKEITATLQQAGLVIEIEIEGVKYLAKACKAGIEKGVKHLSNARMWESGRYVQHFDFPELDFRNPEGEKLPCESVLDIVAWPESLTFNLDFSSDNVCHNASMRISFETEEKTWTDSMNLNGHKAGSISLTCDAGVSCGVSSAGISVKAHGQSFPVNFDKKKNCYIASVNDLKRNWKTGYTDIRNYDDFIITVDRSNHEGPIPFLLDLRPPANITGLSPILCDEQGRPIGIPVQLSKNWHYDVMGSYLMAYTILPAEKEAAYLLRIVYGFYGQIPSASHAQLSLVGYGSDNNGRWDQLAIGSWGETICFDMDMSCVDIIITDIRMLMCRNGIDGEKWNWKDAGWGGDWINIKDSGQIKYYPNSLKTAYLSQGPCLTNVKHKGYYGQNREVEISAQIRTLRTDDYSRTFQKLSYKFMRDVSAQHISLFKIGRTNYYTTPKIAYGNLDGCIRDLAVPDTLTEGQMFLDNVELTGSGPWWIAFTGASSRENRDWGTGYRALVIRDYYAQINGKTYNSPTISAPAQRKSPPNLDIELLPPLRILNFKKGDSIELDLELVTLPRVAEDYYGPNEFFREHLVRNPNSWKTAHREAKGNDLQVTVRGGEKLKNYPLLVRAEKDEVTIVIKGGVGLVPVTFECLDSYSGYNLYQEVKGDRVRFDQSVHGNDFWQTDHDPVTGLYSMTFNLPLDGLEESKWIFARSDQ
jgi:hypothetical protein